MKILPFRCMIILNNGLAVKTARPRLSSLLIGNRSPSFGSVYDSTNGTSINLCRRSMRVLKCSYVPTSVLGNEIRRNSASNCKTIYHCNSHYTRYTGQSMITDRLQLLSWLTLLLISSLAIVRKSSSYVPSVNC